MRLPRARAELRVELARDEERMLGDLDDLDELLLRPHAGDPQAALLELAQVVVVHFVPVAMALLDDALPVEPGRGTALAEHDRIVAEPHRAALRLDRALFWQEIDHVVRRMRVELRRVGAREVTDVARVLDHRALHAETDAEVRHALLAREAHRLNLAFDPTVAEAAGHEDAVHAREARRGTLPLDPPGGDPPALHPR